MREKIAEILSENFGVDKSREKEGILILLGKEEAWLRKADQILSLIREEIGKGLLMDEEMKGCTHKVSTSPGPYAFTKDDGTLINPNTWAIVDMKRLAQAQLEKILTLLRNV